MSFTRRADVPQKIGRYEVLEPIGYGAMGAVYKGFDPLIRRTVAIKTIRLDVPPGSPSYRAFIERFRTEVQVSGTLSHPNIVTLFDIGDSEDKLPFLTMEYVEGETIADLLDRGGRLQPERVVGLVSQVASAIDYAHAKGVVHRDIKPSNIIVYDGEKLKVTDFGIAKVMDQDVTQTETLLGTPSYMSPEQAMGENLDGRTDIFSLGVVAFEMLSGQQPFPGNNVTSVLYKLVHVDPVRPDNLELLGLIPHKWHEVFSKVLAKNPADRYETAASFVSDLELCLGSWFGALEGEQVVGALREDPGAELPAETAAVDGGAPEAEFSDVEAGAAGENGVEEKEGKGSYEVRTVRLSSEDWAQALGAGEAGHGDDETIGTQRLERHALDPSSLSLSNETITDFVTRVEKEEEPSTTTLTLPGVSVVRSDPAVVPTRAATLPGAASRAPSGRRGRLALRLGFASLVILTLAGVLSAIAWLGKDARIDSFAVPPVAPAVGGAADEAAQQGGELNVETTPEDVRVLIDGRPAGSTPLRLEGLSGGLYLVRLEKDGFESVELPARVTPGEPELQLRANLESIEPGTPPPPRRSATAQLDVSSSPPGARVLVDGKPIGETPLEGRRVEPGKRRIRLEKEGFEPWEQTIRLFDGTTSSVSAELEPLAGQERRVAKATGVREGDLVERGPDVTDPVCVHCPAAPYPDVARRNKLEGLVEVSFIVTETGEVTDIEITGSTLEVFNQAAIDALRGYLFEPATKDGVRVKVKLPWRFRFQRGR